MDIFWIALGLVLFIVGWLGCILPILPGPPLCFIALWIQQLKEEPPFSNSFLWIWAGITTVVLILEYMIPVMGTKKFGGTKYGMWGCMIGMVVGIFIGPLGIIIGPFVGALIGELIGNNNQDHALRAAIGSFIGFLLSTLLKLIACSVMGYYLIKSVFTQV